jgi:hypothetical protein
VKRAGGGGGGAGGSLEKVPAVHFTISLFANGKFIVLVIRSSWGGTRHAHTSMFNNRVVNRLVGCERRVSDRPMGCL